MSTHDQEQARLGPVEWIDRIPSTNTDLLRRIGTQTDIRPGYVLAARHQSAGRGRNERVWYSGAGRDLTFSFLWSMAPIEQMVSMPMATALAVSDVLELYGIHAQTKWPNDILVDGRKICGLLTESATDRTGQTIGAVVGVGLNVNMSVQDAANLDRLVTSMRILTSTFYAVEAVLERLLPLLSVRLAHWGNGGFSAIRADWEARAVWANQPVTLHTDAGPLTGILRGYGEAGELLLEIDHKLHHIWSAELLRPARDM